MIIHSRRFVVNKLNNKNDSDVSEAQFKLFCKKCSINVISSDINNIQSFDMKAFTGLRNEYNNLKTNYKNVARKKAVR